MIDVGLIGFGFAGRTFHAPVLQAVTGLRFAVILERSGLEASKLYPDSRVVRNLEDLLAIETIRLVVVATPNVSHYEIARQCLLAGKDVVIDKPFATTSEEACELVKLATEKRRLLSVYQNRRWDGDFMTLRQLIETGAVGRLALYESHFDRYRPQVRSEAWREREQPGSGLLFDLGPHLIDQALLLFGTPQAVRADVRVEREGAVVDDAFDVTLHYSRLRVMLRATMLARAPGPRFLLHGTQGSYVKYGLDPQEDALKQGETPGSASWGTEKEDAWGILSTADGQSRRVPTQRGDYRHYYENVRDALSRNDPLAVTADQALDVMRTLELARESSALGCAIPWSRASGS